MFKIIWCIFSLSLHCLLLFLWCLSLFFFLRIRNILCVPVWNWKVIESLNICNIYSCALKSLSGIAAHAKVYCMTCFHFIYNQAEQDWQCGNEESLLLFSLRNCIWHEVKGNMWECWNQKENSKSCQRKKCHSLPISSREKDMSWFFILQIRSVSNNCKLYLIIVYFLYNLFI